MLAYLLRRVPHCGDFFAYPLGGATEAIWLHTVGSRSKASPDRKKRPGMRGLVWMVLGSGPRIQLDMEGPGGALYKWPYVSMGFTEAPCHPEISGVMVPDL